MYIKRKCRGPDGGRVKKLFRSWFSNLNGGPRVWVRLSQGQASTCAVLRPSEAYYRVIRTWRRLCIVRIIRRTLFVNTYTVRLAEINVRVGSHMNRIIDRQTTNKRVNFEKWKWSIRWIAFVLDLIQRGGVARATKRVLLRLSATDRLTSIIVTFPAATTRFFYYSTPRGSGFIPWSRWNAFH